MEIAAVQNAMQSARCPEGYDPESTGAGWYTPMPSREIFSSETTVRGDEGEGKGVVGRRMMRF